jgi:hypothetical protein
MMAKIVELFVNIFAFVTVKPTVHSFKTHPAQEKGYELKLM